MYAISIILPLVFVGSLIFKNKKPEILSLVELNEECGVHNFDLNGIKNTNIVMDGTTESKDGLIMFRGCGSDINNRLNSVLASHRGWFNVYLKVDKGRYLKWARGYRVGNYEARYDNGRIKYVFPMKITYDLYTPTLFLRR
jgi:hypothetical protein